MADANLKSRTLHAERSVTIQQSRRWRPYSPRWRKDAPLYPWMKLSGRWLELAGFKPRQRVKIEVHDGKLVITPH